MLIGPASRLTGSYTWYESHTGANIPAAAPGRIVRALTVFPGTKNVDFTDESTSASHDLDFQLADANYEALFINSDRRRIGLLAGAVYGQLQQDFSASYPFSPPEGTTSVVMHVDFHGAGIQVGLEGEQRIWRKLGFCVYGRGMSRFLCGQFRSSYLQTNEFNGVEVTTSIKDARIVPLLDLEIGVSWISEGWRPPLWRIHAEQLVQQRVDPRLDRLGAELDLSARVAHDQFRRTRGPRADLVLTTQQGSAVAAVV
jgi:hypothetical protein